MTTREQDVNTREIMTRLLWEMASIYLWVFEPEQWKESKTDDRGWQVCVPATPPPREE